MVMLEILIKAFWLQKEHQRPFPQPKSSDSLAVYTVLIHLNPVVNTPVLSAFGVNNSLFGVDNSNPL